MYKFNTIPTKSQQHVYRYNQDYFKVYMATFLKKNKEMGGISLSDFKTYIATVIKTCNVWGGIGI